MFCFLLPSFAHPPCFSHVKQTKSQLYVDMHYSDTGGTLLFSLTNRWKALPKNISATFKWSNKKSITGSPYWIFYVYHLPVVWMNSPALRNLIEIPKGVLPGQASHYMVSYNIIHDQWELWHLAVSKGKIFKKEVFSKLTVRQRSFKMASKTLEI